MEVKSLKNEEWALVRLKGKSKTKRYYVSNLGRVKSIDKNTKREFLLKGLTDSRGCRVISFHAIEGSGYFIVHKEVAKKFVEKPSRKHEFIIHKNFDKKDDRAKNLQWVTRTELSEYIGKRQKKLGIGKSSVLTISKVALLKKYLLEGKKTKAELSKKFGISSTQIKRIERGENWKDVKPKA